MKRDTGKAREETSAVEGRLLRRGARILKKAGKWSLVLALVGATAAVTLAVVSGVASRRLPDLKPWHRVRLRSEFRERDLAATTSLGDYLAREERLFGELEAKLTGSLPPEDRLAMNRYWSEAPSSPSRFDPEINWNRTVELIPDGPVRGGALLLHGLTDSPYTLRHVAEIYRSRGFYVLVLRLPGHGTAPAALLDAEWEDWRAAVKVGARAVRARVGPGLPLHLVGYSNGGALALQYTLEILEGSGEPPVDSLILLSPMIGVSPFARLAPIVGWMGRFQPFEKARWVDVMPEYNPYKYNSFPVHAGHESFRLTKVVQRQIGREGERGLLAKLPPILCFMSAVDATVSTGAVVESLFSLLPAGRGDEMVVFDLNTAAEAVPFLRASDRARVAQLLTSKERHYALSVLMNARPGTAEVAERRVAPGSGDMAVRFLGMKWPSQVYSLSHIALPVAPEDPLFGPDGPIGSASPRGEKGVLTVPEDQFMRLSYNPFFPYLREKVEAIIPK